MTLIAGFDVSHFQSAGQVADAVVHGAFVFVKATEGVSYVDPEHDADIAVVRAAHRRPGHYHFAKDTAAAYAEAQWFLDHAGVRPGDLVALDLEAMNGSWSQRVTYAVAWLTYVQKATGARPFWYVNRSWHDALEAQAPLVLDRWPLWIADPQLAGASTVHLWVIQQYSTGGGMDHDVANHDLALYAAPGPHPQPPPAPTPAPVPELEDDDMALRPVITEWDDPASGVPDAIYLVDMVALTREWMPNAVDVNAALLAGAVRAPAPLTPEYMKSLTPVGLAAHS